MVNERPLNNKDFLCVTELDELVIICWNNTEMEWHLKLSQAKYYFAQNATLHKILLCTKCNFAQNTTLHKMQLCTKCNFAQNSTLHKIQLCTKCNFAQTRNVNSDLLFFVYMCITKPFSTKSKF